MWFSSAHDDSTDMKHSSCFFVWGISETFEITEALLSLELTKGTAEGLDLYERLNQVSDVPLK